MLSEIIMKIGLGLMLAGFSFVGIGLVVIFVGYAIGETFL